MKFSVLIGTFASFAAFAGNAAEMTIKKVGGLDIPQKYRICKTDADCTAVQDLCSRWSWHPINKANAAAATKLFWSTQINCISANYPQPATACIKDTCVIEPDAGNCIFRTSTPESACWITCKEKDANGVCIFPDEQP